MDQLSEALVLMRRALELIDEVDDPFLAAPHLDLAISRVEQSLSSSSGNDNHQNPDDLA